MQSAVTRTQLPKLESAATHSQPQDGISLKSYPAAGTRVSSRKESVTGIQLVSNQQDLSQLQDRISYNSYPAAGTQVSHGIESAVTCIQLLEQAAAQFLMKIRDNRARLFISFETVNVNNHEGRSGAHIFLFMCLS